MPLPIPLVQLGRDGSNHIKLEDLLVSRQHCLLRFQDSIWIVEDLSSANGTFVNGERIMARALVAGDHLSIGDSAFLFLETEGPDRVSIDEEGQDLLATIRLPVAETGGRSTTTPLITAEQVSIADQNWPFPEFVAEPQRAAAAIAGINHVLTAA